MARKTKKKLDAFHWHEALDRSLLAFEFFSGDVEEHPAIQSTPALKRDAREIGERLFQFYQTLGRMNLGDDDSAR